MRLTQKTSYTSNPTSSSVDTLRLGSRTNAMNATHRPMPKAEKQPVLPLVLKVCHRAKNKVQQLWSSYMLIFTAFNQFYAYASASKQICYTTAIFVPAMKQWHPNSSDWYFNTNTEHWLPQPYNIRHYSILNDASDQALGQTITPGIV